MRQVVLMLLGPVILAACAMPAHADVVLAGSFDEHISDAKVAGQVLVGLWLGEPVGKIALDQTKLVLPARTVPLRACVTANTRDGEYWMHGVFLVPKGPAEFGNMPIRSQYKDSLATYKLSDLGVLAELKQDCGDAAPGPLVPAVSDHDATTLVALVNSQRAVRVQSSLQARGADIATETCQRFDVASGRSTAFDTICRIALPGSLAAGTYTLEFMRRTRAGDSESDSFPVKLDTASRRSP
jgi:hypothetical protein